MPKTLTLTLPDEVYQRLEEEAKRKGVSVEEAAVHKLVGREKAERMKKWIDKVQGTIADFTTDEIMELTRG